MQKFLSVKLLTILLAVCVGSACASDASGEAATGAAALPTLPDDFVDFYRRFHADTSFQIRHVSFPLAGNYHQASDSSAVEDLKYERTEWLVQRDIPDDGSFVRGFSVLDSTLVFEEIKSRVGNYTIERRWAKLSDGEWNLIYYRVNGV